MTSRRRKTLAAINLFFIGACAVWLATGHRHGLLAVGAVVSIVSGGVALAASVADTIETRHRLAREALLMLRDQLGEAAPLVAADSPAMGCCGCGSWMADVRTAARSGAPYGEAYCWACVPRYVVLDYTVLPGRER